MGKLGEGAQPKTASWASWGKGRSLRLKVGGRGAILGEGAEPKTASWGKRRSSKLGEGSDPKAPIWGKGRSLWLQVGGCEECNLRL